MQISKYSYTITVREVKKIEKNLNAFINNFGIDPIIYKDKDKHFLVYLSEEKEKSDEYVQHCENIDYLNGWLYGAVQAICGQIPKIKKA